MGVSVLGGPGRSRFEHWAEEQEAGRWSVRFTAGWAALACRGRVEEAGRVHSRVRSWWERGSSLG